MDEGGNKSFRLQSSVRRPRRSVENTEDIGNFSKYLAEMIPQEKVAMERYHGKLKMLLETQSELTSDELKWLFEHCRNMDTDIDTFTFARYEPNQSLRDMGEIFLKFQLTALQALDDNVHTDPTFYKGFPCKTIEQGLGMIIPMLAELIKPGMVDMPMCYQVKVLGSFADGLAIPYVVHREDTAHSLPTDLDVMLVLSPPFFPTVTSRRISETTTKGSFVVDGRGCHPGYVKLKIQGQHWLFEVLDILEPDPGGIYLSNKCVQVYTKRVNSSSQVTLLKKMLEKLRIHVNLHGPAMTYEMLSSFYNKDDLVVAGDFVASFPWNEFPREADEWLSRKRESGWPNMEQIRAVKELGCHLVPVANPGDKDCRTEWRISFVLAERHLALSLNQVQRHVHRIIKLIHKTRLGESSILSSYHLKTTLFWLCERIPQDRWTNEEMGQRFYDFYDLLLDFLHKKYIPNYFIPENNMIDYIDEECVNEIVTTIHTILHNPKTILTEIQAKYEIRFDLPFLHGLMSNRFLQGICGAKLKAMVDSPENDSDSVKGAVGGTIDTLSKNHSHNPLSKEKEEKKGLTDMFMKEIISETLLGLGHSAVGEDIIKELGDLAMKTSTDVFKQVIDDEQASEGYQLDLELFGKFISLLKEIDFELTQADEHADKQAAATRKLSYPTHNENDDQHNAKRESFEDQSVLPGNKENQVLEFVGKPANQEMDIELKQPPPEEHADDQKAASREILYIRNDKCDDEHYAARQSFDFFDEDRFAPSCNKKNRVLGKPAGQLEELDLD